GAVARVVDPVSLHDGALHAPAARAHRAHAGIHVHADLPALAVGIAEAAPAADVVVLDDHVVRAGHQLDRVLLRAFQREAAHYHVRRGDRDVAVAAVDGCAAAVIDDIARRAAAFGDRQRFAIGRF